MYRNIWFIKYKQYLNTHDTYNIYMRQNNKHRAIIDDNVIEELVNKKIIKLNKDGRVESLSFFTNNTLKEYLKKVMK
jgi:hypothetical protein